MIRTISTAILLSACICGCEVETSICHENADCAQVCQAYAANMILYACNEGRCQCVAPETLKCTGDETKDNCDGICAKYRPGTQAACTDGYCECQEPKEGGVQ